MPVAHDPLIPLEAQGRKGVGRMAFEFQLVLRLLMMLFVSTALPAVATEPKISAGWNSLAVKQDGSVLTWGSDVLGQLGIGTKVYRDQPGLVPGLSGVVKVSIGYGGQVVALKSNATVWAWGDNSEGQLGDGTTANRPNPTPMKGWTDVIDIATGSKETIALRADGTVWSWGNSRGQSVAVPGLTNIVAIAGFSQHALALKKDGTVWAWGWNSSGELGDGTEIYRDAPVAVYGLKEVEAIAAGLGFSVALKRDGTVWTWGWNKSGQLGDQTQINRATPARIENLSNVVAISAGAYGAAAVKSDGKVSNWGSPRLESLANLSDVVSVAFGDTHAIVLNRNGTIWTVGENNEGQLGNGSTTDSSTPLSILGIADVVAVAAAPGNSAVLKRDGTVWIWGGSHDSMLGVALTTNSSIPVGVNGLHNVTAAAVGYSHVVALKTDRTVWAWGGNYSSELGDGTHKSRATPGKVQGLSDVASVAARYDRSAALKTDGTVWIWGKRGQVEFATDGSTSYPEDSTPTLLPGFTGIQEIALGRYHTVALKANGTVWTWGNNASGQLGNGTTIDNMVLSVVPGLTEVVAVAAGGDWVVVAGRWGGGYSVALKKDGSVWAWGDNQFGQLGNGTYNNYSTSPVKVPVISRVIAIAAGYSHTLALDSDGKLWAWGFNDRGQLGLGDGTKGYIWIVPELVGTGFTNLAAGLDHGIALKRDGTLWSWGENIVGQLGDGTLAERVAPVLVVNETGTDLLDLIPDVPNNIAPGSIPPLYLIATGNITDTSASIATSTQFNPADTGKAGSVFVTAMVPAGSLGTTPISGNPNQRVLAAKPRQLAATSSCGAPINPLTLVQLTPSGWQTVVNGQLIPYASGVLGDQLAAQTILSGTDTTQLKGAEFCVGYGANAQDMINNGNIRAVATIPGANTTSSCVVGGTISVNLRLVPGWNLLGNPINQNITVAAKFGDASKVNSVWKWDATKANWQFYAPELNATALQSYAASNGYSVLSEINPGDGYWVNAKTTADLGALCGSSINLRRSSLASGWNLVSTASAITPQDFNLSLSTTPPTPGQTPVNMESLWAWDEVRSQWYFYAPALDAQGGSALASYIKAQNYEDFGSNAKALGNGAGFWVRRP